MSSNGRSGPEPAMIATSSGAIVYEPSARRTCQRTLTYVWNASSEQTIASQVLLSKSKSYRLPTWEKGEHDRTSYIVRRNVRRLRTENRDVVHVQELLDGADPGAVAERLDDGPAFPDLREMARHPRMGVEPECRQIVGGADVHRDVAEVSRNQLVRQPERRLLDEEVSRPQACLQEAVPTVLIEELAFTKLQGADGIAHDTRDVRTSCADETALENVQLPHVWSERERDGREGAIPARFGDRFAGRELGHRPGSYAVIERHGDVAGPGLFQDDERLLE
jgi:hypothetical protein